jgi:hypothetical protein
MIRLYARWCFDWLFGQMHVLERPEREDDGEYAEFWERR